MTGFVIFNVISQSVSIFIIMLNFIARLFFMCLAEYVGFRNDSEKASFITTTVFVSAFFQTGWLCLVAPWSTSREFDEGGVNKLFTGIYTDFNPDWFADVGYTIQYNMIFNIFWPIMEFFMYYGLRHLTRMWDQRKWWPNAPEKTRSQTLSNFEKIYLGPLFLVHYKYSFLMNIIFCTFMYGPLLPILFPIALC